MEQYGQNLPEFKQTENDDFHQSFQDANAEEANRLLNSKLSRKKIELDAMALKNRIFLLENEENKVMKKIEETKRKALTIIQIKQRNKDHEDEQNEYKKYDKLEMEAKKSQVEKERKSLQQAVDEQRGEYFHDSKSKANEIKQNLQKLRERYRIQKKEEQIHNIQSVNSIRLFEKELESSKRQMLEQIQEHAKYRYDKCVYNEECKKENILGEIDSLEKKEQDLIKRLKVTQNHHQMAMTDLDRINKNKEPVGILLDTKLAWEKRTPNRKSNVKRSVTPNLHRNN